MARRKEAEKFEFTLGSKLMEALAKFEEVELEDVQMEIGDLEIVLQPSPALVAAPPKIAPLAKPKPVKLLQADFKPPIVEYAGQIVEVQLGATRSEGGTRGISLLIGGEKSPAFYIFENPMPHRPVIALDVFDAKIPLAKAVKMHIEDVLEDPAEWAKRSVEKFSADMINLHLVSIDPLLKDTPPKEAAKTVEDVLQAVDVPLAIGGCGDPRKDLEVFQRVAEVASGERLLFCSVTLDMDIEKSAQAIGRNGHVALAFTPMDMNRARELNRKLYDYLPRERIVIDTTTAALGYGLDYAFTIMERTRLAGLMGDRELQHPMSSGTTNAWAAREAWMQMDSRWGPRELRGPIWETITALTLMMAGVDYFMMMHPAAVKTVKDVMQELLSSAHAKPDLGRDWVSMKI